MSIEMTDLEKEILSLLDGCRGEANALRRRNLVEILARLGFGDRKVREAINHLVVQHGEPIVSTSRGYFRPITSEEIRKAGDYLHSYAMSLLKRESIIRDRPMRQILGQLEIDFRDAGPIAGEDG